MSLLLLVNLLLIGAGPFLVVGAITALVTVFNGRPQPAATRIRVRPILFSPRMAVA